MRLEELSNCDVYLSYGVTRKNQIIDKCHLINEEDLELFTKLMAGNPGWSKKDNVMVFLQTLGGKIQVGAGLMDLLHSEYKSVHMIACDYAKSTGAVMFMSSHQPYMHETKGRVSDFSAVNYELSKIGHLLNSEKIQEVVEGLNNHSGVCFEMLGKGALGENSAILNDVYVKLGTPKHIHGKDVTFEELKKHLPHLKKTYDHDQQVNIHNIHKEVQRCLKANKTTKLTYFRGSIDTR